MALLIAALVLVLLGGILFLFQGTKENWASLVPPGLAAVAFGLAFWIADAMHRAGAF